MIKKTAEQKQKQGTLKKSREKAILTYDPLIKVPSPTFKLTTIGRSYFTRFCQILISNKTLTVADIPLITRTARWYEIYKQSDKDVAEHGAVQITSTGYTQKSGYLTVMTDAEDRIVKSENLYGMNLSARTKINLPKTEKKNPFDEI